MPCPLPRRPARQLLSSLCHELWQAKGCTDTGIRMSISPCSRPREREQETQLPSFTTCRSLGGETETEGRCGLPYHPPPATPSQWGMGGGHSYKDGPWLRDREERPVTQFKDWEYPKPPSLLASSTRLGILKTTTGTHFEFP